MFFLKKDFAQIKQLVPDKCKLDNVGNEIIQYIKK